MYAGIAGIAVLSSLRVWGLRFRDGSMYVRFSGDGAITEETLARHRTVEGISNKTPNSP